MDNRHVLVGLQAERGRLHGLAVAPCYPAAAGGDRVGVRSVNARAARISLTPEEPMARGKAKVLDADPRDPSQTPE
jgi:hypothetical protein